MDLPDPYLPGAISLFEQLDKKLIVVLRDGRKLIGYLKSIDQFANLILEDVVERTFVGKYYCDINQGFLLIRGENVEIAGEIDESIPMIYEQVSVEEIQKIEESLAASNSKAPVATNNKLKDDADDATGTFSYLILFCFHNRVDVLFRVTKLHIKKFIFVLLWHW
ncbi:unnamed protein product [Cylicocyclus nassatus]|uniref:U6 snRNA-associated Sm-like protein LSm1 n=1 Tax=Cylicocyclus nassatus TaxID=53992 RepID=A0AA36HA92_CYLNA|nr:unnamed protein product [Cylicocyclus nassatus]